MSDALPSRGLVSSDADLSGVKLGNYQVLRRLGRGGMADVYLAEQLSLRRQVAFKVLKRTLADDEAYVRRFHHEAQAAASLVQANIVQIYEVGCVEGVHYIAQEYVAGQNLKQWLARHGSADAATAVHIMRQVAAALGRAAQQGIIHRDIKPENIMLARTGEVKVADFGLARVTGSGASAGLTQVGVTMGTPLYMSPEQVEGRSLDPRSDLYSFGVTCYEMLAGHPPFTGETPLSVAVQHLKSEPALLENLRPDVPAGLCRIVHGLLAKAPTSRYQSASDVLRDLRALPVAGLERWPTGDDDWDMPDAVAFADACSEATLRLDGIMKSSSFGLRRRHAVVWVLAALLVGSLAGGAAAWVRRPPYLLNVSAEAIERKESAKLQYWHAMKLNTEAAWLSVARYFPPEADEVNRVYVAQSQQRLAELYREQNQPEKALALYTQLTASRELQFAAQGLVGRANILASQGKQDLATAELVEAAWKLAQLPQDEQIRSVLQWLDADLHETFLQVAHGVERLDALPLELMLQ
ncbi:MAG: protein kinase [Pirellulaceae bacterium]|jgi:serine/threonine-protein kinase|nr:protein kinase [Pirellulaceae bacterium]